MRLIAKTHKGKNKIREAGTDEWEVAGTSPSVAAFGGAPGLLIQPVRAGFPTIIPMPSCRRWIRAENDPDFELENPTSY